MGFLNYVTLVSSTIRNFNNAIKCKKNVAYKSEVTQERNFSMVHHLIVAGFARAMTVKGSGQFTDYVATRWYRSPELLLG